MRATNAAVQKAEEQLDGVRMIKDTSVGNRIFLKFKRHVVATSFQSHLTISDVDPKQSDHMMLLHDGTIIL